MSITSLTTPYRYFLFILSVFSVATILFNMYFAYVTTYNIAAVHTLEEEIYAARVDIMKVSGNGTISVEHDDITVSHVVVVEPVAVSVSH